MHLISSIWARLSYFSLICNMSYYFRISRSITRHRASFREAKWPEERNHHREIIIFKWYFPYFKGISSNTQKLTNMYHFLKTSPKDCTFKQWVCTAIAANSLIYVRLTRIKTSIFPTVHLPSILKNLQCTISYVSFS